MFNLLWNFWFLCANFDYIYYFIAYMFSWFYSWPFPHCVFLTNYGCFFYGPLFSFSIEIDASGLATNIELSVFVSALLFCKIKLKEFGNFIFLIVKWEFLDETMLASSWNRKIIGLMINFWFVFEYRNGDESTW